MTTLVGLRVGKEFLETSLHRYCGPFTIPNFFHHAVASSQGLGEECAHGVVASALWSRA